MVSAILPVYCTKEQGVGFIPLLQDPNRHDYGNLTDFNRGREPIPGQYDPTEDDWGDDDPYLKVRVYNLEVEDFHTYFVDCGVWVHNTNCEPNLVMLPEIAEGLNLIQHVQALPFAVNNISQVEPE
ncbi:hypothetical protein GM173_10520 [Deefgea chitinilytica]|uniref:Intein C-terminal splicing domain-containing protein n=2 Tax=Chitinibacteraceae TaxID=2897177 RepID=A0ABS2CD65_9NEIS|nr:hypothetical protein [Deefgea chitinilytica]